MLARFKRDQTYIRFLTDTLGDGYYIFTESPDICQRVEHFPMRLYPTHCDLYVQQGYRRLTLCTVCGGKGWQWVGSGDGDADRDLCPACQGKGGTAPMDTRPEENLPYLSGYASQFLTEQLKSRNSWEQKSAAAALIVILTYPGAGTPTTSEKACLAQAKALHTEPLPQIGCGDLVGRVE